MPRARRQVQRCACLDCIPDTESTNVTGLATSSRQDPPPKCLILFHTNVKASDIQEEEDKVGSFLPHIDSVIREGGCGLLSAKGSLSGDALHNATQSFLQLFGPPSESPSPVNVQGQGVQRTQSSTVNAATFSKLLLERFQGMQASLFSSMQQIRDIAARHGLAVFNTRRIDTRLLSSPSSIARHAAQRFGFGQSSRPEIQKDNVVLIHVDSELSFDGQENLTSLEWVDAFIKSYDEIQDAKSSTLTFFIAGPFDSEDFSLPHGGEAISQAGYSFLQPLQSFEASPNDSSIMYIASRRLQGVVRRDVYTRLRDFARFRQGSYSTMPLERVFQDIAYKIGCAGKYGS